MSKKIFSRASQRGQVGIIVLLVAAIVLVVGLAVANRTIQESQLNLAQEDTARVFSTAESGVQQALNNIFQFETEQTLELPGEFSFDDSNLNQVSIASTPTFNGFLPERNSLEIRIDDNQTGNIDIHWSQTSCAQGASNLLIGHYYQDGGVHEVDYFMVGNCPQSGDQNLLAVGSSSLAGYQFQYTHNVTAAKSQSAFLRIIPLGGNTNIRVSGVNNLLETAQYTILSLAQMPDGSSAKAIEVVRSLPTAPTFMEFALVSGGNLEK